MKESLINQILKTGNQIPRNKLETLTVDSLKMIITLRKEYAK